jgi:hypothetical protein
LDAGEQVKAFVNGEEFATTTADSDGHFSETLTVPSSASPGEVELKVVGVASGNTASTSFQVT